MSPSLETAAAIVAVGSELLTPFRTDTNSLYLTGKLNELGIDVRAKFVVRDDRVEIAAVVRELLTRVDLIVVTGGLGPTDDDVTREAVAAACDVNLTEDAAILAALRERFAKRGIEMPQINRRQAMVPAGGAPLANANGSAPGMWLDRGDRVVVLLPGPPRELQPIYEGLVALRLRARTGERRLRRRVINIAGRAESAIDEIAQPIYSNFHQWPVPVETTILAGAGQIELHLSASGADVVAIDEALARGVRALAEAIGPAVFSVDGRSLEQVIGDGLIARGWRIAAAESCTAGLLMARLTDVPGSSAYVAGGIVAYADAVKVEQVGVAAELIKSHGAVSEPIAEALARGVADRLHANVGVGITGIAGPAGGSAGKPVGMVCIAVHVGGGASLVRTQQFLGDRHSIRQFAAQAALDMVRRTLALE